jgi:NitT/TauT family transport system substrate-binding protein
MQFSISCWTRRRFLSAACALSSSAPLLGRSGRATAQPQAETTRIRFVGGGTPICLAPQYLAEGILRAEGFTEVQYTKTGKPPLEAIASGEADLCMEFAGVVATHVDMGNSITALAGVHIGCLELVVRKGIRAIRDVKGKRIAVFAKGSSEHVFLATMAAQIGLDPNKDIEWVIARELEAVRLLTTGRIDGFLAWAPEPQELRAKGIGYTVLNTATDKPWSQYYCCMVVGNSQFVEGNPIATKRALRAILKSADICSQEPERAARYAADNGFTPRYDYALQALKELPYGVWRTHNPEDTVRFYALRLHEVGMIKSNPQKIVAQGTNWRFLNELRTELKV